MMQSTVISPETILSCVPISAEYFNTLLLRDIKVPEEYDLIAEHKARCLSAGVPDTSESLMIGDGAQLLLPIDPLFIRFVQQAIYCDFGVLLRLKVSADRLQVTDPEVTWISQHGRQIPPVIHVTCPLVAYSLAGPIAVINGRRQKISWGFLSRFSEIAYVPIPAFSLDVVQRSFDISRLTSLAAR